MSNNNELPQPREVKNPIKFKDFSAKEKFGLVALAASLTFAGGKVIANDFESGTMHGEQKVKVSEGDIVPGAIREHVSISGNCLLSNVVEFVTNHDQNKGYISNNVATMSVELTMPVVCN